MKPSRNLATTISVLLILLTCLYALKGMMPRTLVSESLPETEFSVARALEHLKVIAKEPHYVGSAYHKHVREYLRAELEKLGMEVEIQEEEVLGKKFHTATRVKNVVAKIKGQGTGKALLLLSHYDSGVYSSYGASDAGSGVVTLLEGMRTYLARGEQPKNDIIVLISDAEEIGLLGAQAFVDKHPWSKDVQLVLNFEARGSGGPGLMFVETNQGNERLIRAFNRAKTSHPVSNSLLYSIYKLMPNDTDLTVFRKYGKVQGFNFAFIDDHFDYHTSQDNFDRLDRNTLQHQASYLMPMLTYFAGADLSDLTSEKDLVFFNFPGVGLIHYPFSWVLPMSVIALILLGGLLYAGVKRGSISIKEIGLGFVPLLVTLSVIGLASYYGWELLLKIHPGYREMIHGFTYNGYLYITAFISLGLWFTLRVYQRHLSQRNAYNLFIPPLLIWLLLSLGFGIYLPGGGFFILAAITGILILAAFLFFKGSKERLTILSTLFALPMLLVFVPLTGMFPVGLGLKMILISTLLSSLILLILLPILATYSGLKNLNKFFLIMALLSFASASYSSGFSKESKRPDRILYLRSQFDSVSYWASRDHQTDEFTRQFLGENPREGRLDESLFLDAGIGGFTFHKKAPTIKLASSEVRILLDSVSEGLRFLKLRMEPSRKINRLDVRLREKSKVISLQVQGQKALKSEESGHLFRYYFSDSEEALIFSYSLPEKNDPSLFILEISYNLLSHPEIKHILPDLKPRQDHLMEKAFIINDAIVNLKEIDF